MEVKPVNIVCSSEDPAFPASNLLLGAYKSSDERKQWLCHSAEEKSAFVIIKYAEPFLISSIELKNAGSAFIQVEAANSHEAFPFTVLWREQNFISGPDSIAGLNTDGTYSFLSSDLSIVEKSKHWDTLKIVCSQPFSNKLQSGLAYIIARTALPVKNELNDFPSGSLLGQSTPIQLPQSRPVLFTAFEQEPLCTKTSSNTNTNFTNIMSPGAMKKEHSSSKDNVCSRVDSPSCVPLTVSEAPVVRVGDSSEDDDEDETSIPVNKQQPPPNINMKRPLENGKESPNKKRLKPLFVTYKPFNKLLEGVKIVISGFVNPFRREIRDKALKMGAKYSPYWSEDSTHLVCAFLYTPKYQQALGEGLIVEREWIDQCFLQRKRLPWQRFALNFSERRYDAGDTEVWELLPSASNSSLQRDSTSSSGGDTNSGGGGVNDCRVSSEGIPALLVPKIEPTDTPPSGTTP